MPTRKQTDLDALQGSWSISALEIDGETMPPTFFGAASITVRGAEFTSAGMGDAYAGTIKVFSQKRPRTVDLAFTSGSPAGMTHLGIYRLDGDEWTICLATRGDVRPTSFATMPDSGFALETLQRGQASAGAKPAAKAKRSPAATAAATPSGPPTEIEGEWAMVSAVLNGVELAPDMVKWCKRVTRGDVTRVLAGPQSMLDATFTVDSSQQPAQIDYVNRTGTNKGKSQAGIYELSGDGLQICVAPPGGKRPAEFSSTKGDGRSLTTWRLSER